MKINRNKENNRIFRNWIWNPKNILAKDIDNKIMKRLKEKYVEECKYLIPEICSILKY